MKALCKNSWEGFFEKGKYYELEKIENPNSIGYHYQYKIQILRYGVVSDIYTFRFLKKSRNSDYSFPSENQERSVYDIYNDHFYTEEEIRKQKLLKLDKIKRQTSKKLNF